MSTELNGLKCTATTFTFLILFLLVPKTIFAQTFVHTYSFHFSPGDVSAHVITKDSNIYLQTANVVYEPFTHVEGGMTKLTPSGEVVWRNDWNFDFGFVGTSFGNGIAVDDNFVYGTGNYLNLETEVFSPAIIKNNLATGTREAIRFPYEHKASIQDLFIKDDSTFLAVSEDRMSDSFQYSIILEEISHEGMSSSSMVYLDSFSVTNATNTVRSASGDLYIAHIGCSGPDATCYPFQGWISKIATTGSVMWNRNYGYTAFRQAVLPKIAVLNDTTIAYAWTRDTNNITIQESPPIIYFLDSAGQQQAEYAFHGNVRSLQKLIACANGDVVGVGYAETDLLIAGWVFRLNSEGELIWERYIQDHRQTLGTETDFTTVTEADDGSIIAAGNIFHGWPPDDEGPRLRAWVVKLDADGCLEPGCTSDTIYLEYPTSVDEPQPTPGLNLHVWPNPTVKYLNWSVPDDPAFQRLTDYRITDTNGRSVAQGEITNQEHRIEVQELLPGVYFLSLYKNGHRRGIQRFVRQ